MVTNFIVILIEGKRRFITATKTLGFIVKILLDTPKGAGVQSIPIVVPRDIIRM
jgi:hypothetical protein